MKKMMKKRAISALLAVLMLVSLLPCAVADTLAPQYTYFAGDMLFEKISHPNTPVEKADGIVDYVGNGAIAPHIPGVSDTDQGDRGHSYSYASASYGDWLYIGTMYGGLSASGILNMSLGEVGPAVINALYNGNMYTGEPDGAYSGGALIKFNVKTGETKILMSRDTNGLMPTFRDAIKFNNKLYFVGMILDMKNSGLSQTELTTAIRMQNGFPCIYEIDPAKGDKMTCIYDCVDLAGYRQLVASGVFTSTRAIGTYKNALIAGTLDNDGAHLVASKNPSAGEKSFTVIADMDDLFNYPKIHRQDANGGGGIYQVIEYNDALYVVVCAGDVASTDPQTGTLRGFAIIKGECNGDPTRKSSWTWSVLAGDEKDGAKYPFALDEERVSAVACTLEVYDGYLYIGDYNDTSSALQNFVLRGKFNTLATNLNQSINLYRMDKNEKIEKVVGDPTTRFPKSLSGLGSGYGTHMSQYTWQATVYNGKLYVSTLDLSTFLRPFVMMMNGDLFRMSREEWTSQINFLRVLVEMIAGTNGASTYSARAQVQQAAQLAAIRKTGREDAEPIELTDEQIAMLNRQAMMRSGAISSQEISQALFELNDMLDEFVELFDENDVQTFNAKYNALVEKYASISDKLPDNVKSVYDLLINVATKDNIQGLLKSLKYMTTAKAGFDLHEITHVGDDVQVKALVRDGMGDRYNHGLRIFEEMDEYWVIGTANPFYGTQLWRTEKEVSDVSSLPQTGDESQIVFWAMMLLAACSAVLVLSRKKREA